MAAEVHFYLIAGEPSGDRLGAALMAALRVLVPHAKFHGVGGPAMTAEGLQSLFPMEELSVMGIAEVLPKYFSLKRRIAQCAKAALAVHPVALITIDSPDFCLRVAKIVKDTALEIPTVHYVAPSVWAWRPKRAEKMAQVIDHVMALLPFEPPYMHDAGMSCDFVGHPVVSEPVASEAEVEAFRAAHGIAPEAPLLAVLPGSRMGEVTRLLPKFEETTAELARDFPDLRLILPTPAHLRDYIAGATKAWRVPPILLPAPDLATRTAAFAASDAALAASGTVSLELAAQNCPMVIGYDMAPVSLYLMKKMIRVDTVTLVNLVSETRAVPEFIGAECRAENLVPPLRKLLNGETEGQVAAMHLTMLRLGLGGEPPAMRAARSLVDYIGPRQPAAKKKKRKKR